MQIDHINIAAPMKLLDEIRDFYCDVLDLKTGFRPDFPVRGYWLYANDRAIIHLSEHSGIKAGVHNGCFDHFALQTANLTEIMKKLDHAGIKYTSTRVPNTGIHQIFFRDPGGTRVELNCQG